MAKKAYIGISNKARTVKNIYVGIGDKARKVIKAYVGDENGKARQWWPAIEKITRIVFSRLTGFDYRNFTVWRTTNSSIDAWGDQSYNMYYSGDFGTSIRYNPYSCFNYIDIAGSGDMGYGNPIKYTWGHEGSDDVWYLDIPGVNGKWYLSIPTLLFGVSQVRFIVDGYNYLTNVWAGIATRVRDEGVETPYEYVQGAIVNSDQNVVIDFNTNGLRADYIHIYADNVLGLKTQLRIKQIIATYERTYGIIYIRAVPPPLDFPPVLYLNFPKCGYVIGDIFEYNIVSAASAVWMLAFNSDNCYTGDHVYADVDAGDYWGTGDTYFLFISKNAFTVKVSSGQSFISQSTSVYGKTIHYYLIQVPEYMKNGSPLHSYAYTEHHGVSAQQIGKIGYVALYSNYPIE